MGIRGPTWDRRDPGQGRGSDRSDIRQSVAIKKKTIHWHGIELRNNMDGVAGLTQPSVKPGQTFTYSFTVPDAGTYWFHPHMGSNSTRASTHR